MDINSYSLSDHEYSIAMITDDSIDEYLVDPNLSVSDMIEKYDVSLINTENKKEKKNLPCAVCSARAFGYNFDQISCESCKAFFRRNALRNLDDLHCRFSGNCTITVETRRHCSYCRIKKCFAVGMKKEWIRSEEEKHMKRIQLDKKRRRKDLQQIPKIPALIQPGHSNSSTKLNSVDRILLNNITHCYDQFTGEPSLSIYSSSSKFLCLRIDEFFNRKRPIFVNLISYFKHLPELKTLNLDDQVSLIKQNIRLVIPLNYAILKTHINSTIGYTRIQTIGCMNDINLHEMFKKLSDFYVQFVKYDPILIKLLITVLFFTTNPLTTKSLYEPIEYKQLDNIKQIQSIYIELLWLYMIEICGEEHAIHLFTKMITKYLYVQIIMDQIDLIIEKNIDIQNIDSLMQTILQLT